MALACSPNLFALFFLPTHLITCRDGLLAKMEQPELKRAMNILRGKSNEISVRVEEKF
jgi:hypothetical protein